MSQKKSNASTEKEGILSSHEKSRSIIADENKKTNTIISLSPLSSDCVFDNTKKISPDNISRRLDRNFAAKGEEGKSTGDSSLRTNTKDNPSTKTDTFYIQDDSPTENEVGAKNNIERALLKMAPRKAKRMFKRRKRARMFGEDDTTGLWENSSASYVRGKSHSLKQIQRLSNNLEQVLGVLCNGDKIVARDVLFNLIKKRHMSSNLLQSVEQKMSYKPEKSIDSRIVDGIVGFIEHHQTRETCPTVAKAVDSVMVACCWDIGDIVDCPEPKPLKPYSQINLEENVTLTSHEKRISNSALIDRLRVSYGTLKRAREKAQAIKTEGKNKSTDGKMKKFSHKTGVLPMEKRKNVDPQHSTTQMSRAQKNTNNILGVHKHRAPFGGSEMYPNPDSNYFRQLHSPQITSHNMNVNRKSNSRINLHPMYQPPSDALGDHTYPGMMSFYDVPHTSIQHQQIMRNQTDFNQAAMLQGHQDPLMPTHMHYMGAATQRSTLPQPQSPAIGAPDTFNQRTTPFRSKVNMNQQLHMTHMGVPGNYNNMQLTYSNQTNIPLQRQPQSSVSGDPSTYKISKTNTPRN